MDDPTRAVLAHIDQRELVDLASALIRIPSFKGRRRLVMDPLESPSTRRSSRPWPGATER